MAGKLLPSFLSKILTKRPRNPHTLQMKVSNGHATPIKFYKYTSLAQRSQELSNETVIFHLEGALLKSSSLFPYFMLVAFEAGGLFRALILFLLYPFVCFVGKELGLKIMVFVCFLGIRKERFRIGNAVLPKFLLEDVGYEGFNIVMSCGRKVAVSDLPRIMVEGFLKDYLGVEAVVGRELKVVCGYFVGLMEEKMETTNVLNELLCDKKILDSQAIGLANINMSLDHQLFSHCKEIYFTTTEEKRNWLVLPREKYQRPLIFHDGRLAFKPTPLATLVTFMWLPLGFFLSIIRITVGIFFPYEIAHPILVFTGLKITLSRPKPLIKTPTKEKEKEKPRGILYACNHRTLLDPIYISTVLMKPLTAVTYSVSRFSEVASPIKTIRLTRDRERDRTMMEKMLSQGDLVVCPEGTTCREPYLLRFSPLFAEVSDDIVPVAIDMQVTMFYGSTASGLKCLDPLFHLMNPCPGYHVKILDKLPSSCTCNFGGKTRFEVANYVQNEIAKALEYECTSFTRKDKYMILAGNEGIM